MKKVWSLLKDNLKEKLTTPGYQTFISSAKVFSLEEGVLTLVVPSDFVMGWIKERCEQQIQEILFRKLEQTVLINYQVDKDFNFLLDEAPSAKNNANKEAEQRSTAPISSLTAAEKAEDLTLKEKRSLFNPRYIFENFVVGNNNRFCHAAALAVAESPAKAYNPLFIYGESGVGKTHLMQAIGQKALDINKFLKVVYTNGETFTNEMIEAIRVGQNKINEFRNKYRTVDILLIDDIQFLMGKEHMQEEFFHTFNALHESNKQIVLNSDRTPKELAKLSDRLKNRFAWGLIADIKAPDLETRLAILKEKTAIESLNVPNDVLEYVAKQIPSNVRELEGALTRIVAHSSLAGETLTVDFAAETLKNIIGSKENKYVTISTIKQVVSEYFNIEIESFSKKVRTKEIAMARQIAMYLSKELTPSSLSKVGNNFGGRDHTTVLHACDKIKNDIKADPALNGVISDLKRDIINK